MYLILNNVYFPLFTGLLINAHFCYWVGSSVLWSSFLAEWSDHVKNIEVPQVFVLFFLSPDVYTSISKDVCGSSFRF